MSLHLITGRANAGKTRPLHAALEESLRNGEAPVLVLPSAPDTRRATREFALAGLIGIRVLTFDRWVRDLWATQGDGRRIVGTAARAAFVGQVVDEASLEVLAASAQFSGFRDLVADIVRRLPPDVNQATTPASREMAALVSSYRMMLDAAGLIEMSAATWVLAGLTPEIGGAIAVNRFTDLPPEQEALLVGLARTNDVYVALTWEQGFPATAGLDGLADRLSSAAESVEHVSTEPSTQPLAVLEDQLYRPQGTAAPTEAVSFGLAAGTEAECALVAGLAAEAVSRGVGPDRIAVVFPDVVQRAAVLETALASEGLPVDFDVALPFPSTPFGRAVMALLDCCCGDSATRERMLAFLQSPYSGADPDLVSAADREWRRGRVAGAKLVAAAGRLRSAGEIIGLARDLCTKPLDSDTAMKWKELASRMLARANEARGLSGYEGAQDAAAHRAMLEAVSELANVGGAMGLADLIRALERTSASTGLAERPGRVQVTEAHRVRSRRFDVLIVGGLTRSEFAAERRESLAAALLGELGAPAETDGRLSSRMLFYLLATRARQRLTLVRQNSTSQGEAVAAAVAFDEVTDVYRDPTDPEAPEFANNVDVRRVSLRQLAVSAPAYQVGRRRLRENPTGLAPQPPTRGHLKDPAVLDALSRIEEFSISEIETYLRCPYSWFYDRAVRPRDMDVEVGAAEAGSHAHKLLQEFYRIWQGELGHDRVTEGSLEQALEALATVEERVERSARVSANGLSEHLQLSRASSKARGLVVDDAEFLPGFTPAHHEFRFGVQAERPVEIGGVRLRGSIDRIDRRADDLVVIDYKSSATIYGVGQFETYGVIQVPVYALAVQKLLGGNIAAGLYRSLSSLKVRGFWDPDRVELGWRTTNTDSHGPADIAAVLDRTAVRVQTAADGIRAGRIEPTPATSGACRNCGAKSICGEAR